ncbi:hypothetical protein P7K49_034218 [Saguinus oedipus]|uniref:Uncharacterized protein n=1 Tax=Saguinus oedipus TaxID=9490 RepID=A0ABQ9TUL2_SAGOE|nr:hypothetical protein P7K49_034218 [Saguinus oedipus]
MEHATFLPGSPGYKQHRLARLHSPWEHGDRSPRGRTGLQWPLGNKTGERRETLVAKGYGARSSEGEARAPNDANRVQAQILPRATVPRYPRVQLEELRLRPQPLPLRGEGAMREEEEPSGGSKELLPTSSAEGAAVRKSEGWRLHLGEELSEDARPRESTSQEVRPAIHLNLGISLHDNGAQRLEDNWGDSVFLVSQASESRKKRP